jgi:hypothetical protein
MMSRTISAFLSVLGGALLLTACDSATAPVSSLRPTGSASADKGSGDDTDACKNGGFANYTRVDGSTFKNQGDCVSYVAQGGQLLPKVSAPPVIASFTFDGVEGCGPNGALNLLFTATFSGGTGSITDPSGAVTPVTSGVRVSLLQRSGIYTLTVTNPAGSATSTFLGGEVPCGDSGPFGNRAPGSRGRIGGG